MRRGLLVAFCVVFNAFLMMLSAQEEVEMTQDTIRTTSATLISADTLTKAEVDQYNKNVDVKLVESFKPNPTKAVIYSAIFPGLGQIYNKKYWKLPIVYGGFIGVVYAISWNGNMYTGYRDAYRDIMIDPYSRTRWHDFVRNPQEVLDNSSRMTTVKNSLKSNRDTFRRNRDLAIIVGVGLYALCMIDAYVDAHLYNFTVTPDLSMTMAPVIWGPSNYSNSVAFGLQCNIVF